MKIEVIDAVRPADDRPPAFKSRHGKLEYYAMRLVQEAHAHAGPGSPGEVTISFFNINCLQDALADLGIRVGR